MTTAKRYGGLGRHKPFKHWNVERMKSRPMWSALPRKPVSVSKGEIIDKSTNPSSVTC